MMQMNIGHTDRLVRLTIAVILLGLAFVLPTPLKWISLIGLVPLLTGLIRWCPLYTLFGLNTCPMYRSK